MLLVGRCGALRACLGIVCGGAARGFPAAAGGAGFESDSQSFLSSSGLQPSLVART